MDKHEKRARELVDATFKSGILDFRTIAAIAAALRQATMAERRRCQSVALTVQLETPVFGDKPGRAPAGRDAYIFGRGVNDTMHAIAIAIEKEPDSHDR